MSSNSGNKFSNFANIAAGTPTGGGKIVAHDSLIVSDVSGKGMKVGDETTQNWGWRDITSSIDIRGVAATDPSWSQVGATNFYAYNFGVDDIVWLTYHIPHDIVPNSDVHFHVHWFPDGTNANSVKWQFEYAYAKGFDQAAFPFGSSTTATVETASPQTQYQHMVSETAAQTITGLSEPDGLVHVALSRITNGGTNNTDGIFVLTADIHYQSTNMATVGKAPSFYG